METNPPPPEPRWRREPRDEPPPLRPVWTHPSVPVWQGQAFEAVAWRPLHSPRHVLLAVALFLLTFGSTSVTWGPAYGAMIMTILLFHEMGHYLMCRRYRVRSTLPLFIPLPLISPFGTMGAVILMRQGILDRKRLFDIGIAGPLAGMIPTLFAVSWGLAHSTVVPAVPDTFAGLRLGDSLLFLGLQKIIHPGMSAAQELMLHPVAYAGWAGLFVTALNLLPIGQLDGGHVVNGLLGPRSRIVSWLFLGALAMLAVYNPQWWVLVALLLLLLTRRRRIVPEDAAAIGGWRVALGILALVIFVLSFTPRPFILP